MANRGRYQYVSVFTGLNEEAACNRLIVLSDITQWLSCIVGDVGTRQSPDLAYDTAGLTVDSLKTNDQNQAEPAISFFKTWNYPLCNSARCKSRHTYFLSIQYYRCLLKTCYKL